MKTGKYHIISSWILLICFIAGQYMVYAHQHNITNGIAITGAVSKHSPRQTVSEKCYLCDVMHHNAMVVTSHAYFNDIAVAGHIFNSFAYNFTSIRLILSSGRAPPASICFSIS